VVPRSYLEFMITAAGAAGAMIGLLFVAVSLRTELVFGKDAPQKARTLASSSFTSLVNAFSLSINAIVPQTNIGYAMCILAVICLYNTLNLHLRTFGVSTQWRVLVVSVLNYLAELAGGITLLARPREHWIVNGLCYVIFASFIIALNRAWLLIKSESALDPSLAP
jgi:hypothetical protein